MGWHAAARRKFSPASPGGSLRLAELPQPGPGSSPMTEQPGLATVRVVLEERRPVMRRKLTLAALATLVAAALGAGAAEPSQQARGARVRLRMVRGAMRPLAG